MKLVEETDVAIPHRLTSFSVSMYKLGGSKLVFNMIFSSLAQITRTALKELRVSIPQRLDDYGLRLKLERSASSCKPLLLTWVTP